MRLPDYYTTCNPDIMTGESVLSVCIRSAGNPFSDDKSIAAIQQVFANNGSLPARFIIDYSLDTFRP
jgi:hypothetical protein